MYMSYDLSRYFEGDLPHSTSFTVSDDDAINCAHMLAAGFNTISRNFMGDFVLAVVDTKAGTVQYDGKIEQINRPEPHTLSTTFKFNGSANGDSLITFFGEDAATTYTLRGDVKVDGPSSIAHVKRDVLEAAYLELEAVKEVLFDAGVETIPADRGVKDLSTVLFARDEKIAELYSDLNKLAKENEELRKRDEHERHARQSMEAQHARSNEAARAEMIEYVKGAYAKLGRLDAAGERDDLQGRMRGMLDVLAKFLVVTGEADHDERHAVARRLCGIPEGARV